MLTTQDLLDYRRSPLLYRYRGFRDYHQEPILTQALRLFVFWGRRTVDKNVAVGGPQNPWTKHISPRAAAAWSIRHPNKLTLSPNLFNRVDDMAEAVVEHEWYVDHICPCRDAVVESPVLAQCGKHECQAQPDWYHPDVGVVSLYDCRNLDRFWSQVWTRGVFHRAAYELLVLNRAGRAAPDTPAYAIAVESRPPYRPGVWRLDDRDLDVARRENATLILRWMHSIERDEWPTGYDELRVERCHHTEVST